jgi:DNA/RNA-binding domain of Phe-tRNA-synthetase-like protein
MPSPPKVTGLLTLNAVAPFKSDDGVRQAVRDLLRQGGVKPTGRSKPASEYLIRAAQESRLTSINLAVDVCNAVSLHSGLPITVIDLDLAKVPLRVGVAGEDVSYVFNAAGQSIDLGGLLCLFDAEGPCGNAVKDAQRTKTAPTTKRTLTLIWGTNVLQGRAQLAEAWYRELLHAEGAKTELVSGEW